VLWFRTPGWVGKKENPGTAPNYAIAESGEPRLPGQSGMIVNMINYKN
jgi:hypothetical protein